MNPLNAIWWSKPIHREGQTGEKQIKLRNWREVNKIEELEEVQ
jgi:hypothetical protein